MFEKLLLYPIMLILPFFVIYLDNYFMMWLLMEIITMNFIMFMYLKNDKKKLMFYYLVQSVSSLLLLLFLLIIENFMNNLCLLMLNLILLFKMGVFPFHFWFLEMMKYLSWLNCFWLMTIQKFIPLMFLNIYILIDFFLLVMFFSLMFCILNLFNKINLKIIMGVSSILNSCWILFILILNKYLWMIYFIIYMMITCFMNLILNKFNLNYILDIMLIKNKMVIYFLFFLLLTLSGVPPLIGFYIKFMGLNLILFSLYDYFMIMMILSSLIMLVYYLRLMLMILMNLYFNWEYYFYYQMKMSNFIFFIGFLYIYTYNF